MTKDQREIQRKLRIPRYAYEIGHVAETRLYFGILRTSFYRRRQASVERGEPRFFNARPVPKRHSTRTSPEREEIVLCLRRKKPSRSDAGHLVFVTRPWHSDARCHCVEDLAARRIKLPPLRDPHAQGSYEALPSARSIRGVERCGSGRLFKDRPAYLLSNLM